MPERILVIRLSALGDVVLATPALRALRSHFPRARIDWLVEGAYADVLRANPHLSSLVVYDKRGEHQGAAGFLKLRQQLRSQKYDLVLDLQRKPKTIALAQSLGAARVVGIRKRTGPELLRSVVGLERPVTRKHAVDLYLDALGELGISASDGAMEIALTPQAKSVAEKLGPAEGGSWVGVAPGARWSTKRWAPARFAELINRFHAEGHRVLLVGGPGDRAVLDEVRAQLARPPDADATDLSIEGLLGALARCSVLVAGDSGPVHMASALGVPVAVIFGPTSPKRWGPRAGAFRVISADLVCSPCSNHGTARCPIGTHACMSEVTVDQVHAAARELLDAPSAARMARS